MEKGTQARSSLKDTIGRKNALFGKMPLLSLISHLIFFAFLSLQNFQIPWSLHKTSTSLFCLLYTFFTARTDAKSGKFGYFRWFFPDFVYFSLTPKMSDSLVSAKNFYLPFFHFFFRDFFSEYVYFCLQILENICFMRIKVQKAALRSC